ncbi:MAG: type II toxin-antitoxin system prevent-host-death family antitoxin [Terracidiphilus sp.]|nr:type II toxin-antitoxin system prevent-host-death family antitoxin [Terracidiphilus sp.]
MREQAISVTEAARNFSDCINRTRYQGTTFILHKNGVPVARIVPAEKKPGKAIKLTGTSSETELSSEPDPGNEETAALPRGLEQACKTQSPSKYDPRRASIW